jgi:hypothetical protein
MSCIILPVGGRKSKRAGTEGLETGKRQPQMTQMSQMAQNRRTATKARRTRNREEVTADDADVADQMAGAADRGRTYPQITQITQRSKPGELP